MSPAVKTLAMLVCLFGVGLDVPGRSSSTPKLLEEAFAVGPRKPIRRDQVGGKVLLPVPGISTKGCGVLHELHLHRTGSRRRRAPTSPRNAGMDRYSRISSFLMRRETRTYVRPLWPGVSTSAGIGRAGEGDSRTGGRWRIPGGERSPAKSAPVSPPPMMITRFARR